jgi:hypothetical protein
MPLEQSTEGYLRHKVPQENLNFTPLQKEGKKGNGVVNTSGII